MVAVKVLTYADYAALPDDGKRYEILDGELFVTPAPSRKHQREPDIIFPGTGSPIPTGARSMSMFSREALIVRPSASAATASSISRRFQACGSNRACSGPPEHQSMTRSARTSTDGGTVSPSARAVLRLTASSNVVGCSIGRSPGRAPLRILST